MYFDKVLQQALMDNPELQAQAEKLGVLKRDDAGHIAGQATMDALAAIAGAPHQIMIRSTLAPSENMPTMPANYIEFLRETVEKTALQALIKACGQDATKQQAFMAVSLGEQVGVIPRIEEKFLQPDGFVNHWNFNTPDKATASWDWQISLKGDIPMSAGELNSVGQDVRSNIAKHMNFLQSVEVTEVTPSPLVLDAIPVYDALVDCMRQATMLQNDNAFADLGIETTAAKRTLH